MKRGENTEILLEQTTIRESQPTGKAKASQKHSRNAQRTALSYTVRKRNGSKRSTKDIQIKSQLKKRKHESNGKKREEAESEIKQNKESQKATQSNVKQR